MKILQKLLFRAKTGYTIKDLGKVNEYQLHFKDIYISILEGEDDWSVGWDYSPVGHLPIREIIEVTDLIATNPDTKIKATRSRK